MQRLKGKKIKVKVTKSFFHRRDVKIVLVVFIFIAILSYPFFNIKKIQAEEVTLYPEKCSGDWANAEVVGGQPTSEPGSISAYVSKPNGGGQIINCENFKGELPEQANIVKAELEFVWSLGYRPMKSENIAPLESSYDPQPISSEEQLNEDDETIKDELNSNKDQGIEINVDDNNVDDNKNSDNSENQNQETKEPSSLDGALLPLLINKAHAQELDSAKDDLIEDVQPVVEQSGDDLVTETEGLTEEPEDLSGSEPLRDGTALFDIKYSLSDNNEQFLNSVFMEKLLDKYSLSLSYNDIKDFKIKLISRMTIDDTSDIYLEAVKLNIDYKGIGAPSSNGPDFSKDELVSESFDDKYWAVLIKKYDTNYYEIWYTDRLWREKLLPAIKKPDNRNVLEKIIDNLDGQTTETPTATVAPKTFDDSGESVITLSSEPLVTDSIKPELVELEKVSNVIEPSTITEEQKIDILNSEDNIEPTWNLIAGSDLVGEKTSISIDEGSIFWLEKDLRAIYFFNIASNSYNSQSYNQSSGDDYAIYRDGSGAKKKARFDSQTLSFIFSFLENEE